MEWEFEPWLVVLMAASAIGYAIGLVRLGETPGPAAVSRSSKRLRSSPAGSRSPRR
jgi:hypothetical protein